MAREKKFVKYALSLKVPAPGNEWRVLNRLETYNNLQHVVDLLKIASDATNDHYLHNSYRERMASGYYAQENWKDAAGNYNLKRVYRKIFPHTPEFKALNEAFLAEYDSREDLQELYARYSGDRYFLYDELGNSYDKAAAADKGYDKRPCCFQMYTNVIAGTEAGSEVELARPTPYQEGDIVMLRKQSVGRRHVDPLFEWRSTPDSTVERIGTVMLVKDKTAHWRGGKGSKAISVLWFGKEEAVDVEERHLKWHERPTFKNGLKSRE